MFQPKNIMERVKTFEDAVAILGENHILVKEYLGVTYNIVITKNLIAYLQLSIICAALNEGWKPTFSDDEYRFYPWFDIYTKDGYEKLNEDEKKKCRVVGRSNDNANANGGVIYACAYNTSSVLYSHNGSRLAFRGEISISE